jgi:hypothetical protein
LRAAKKIHGNRKGSKIRRRCTSAKRVFKKSVQGLAFKRGESKFFHKKAEKSETDV